jgi:PAS domain S-box-containing protein
VKHAPDGIITIDLNGKITWINETFTSMTGFTTKEIVGKCFLSLKCIRVKDIPSFIKIFINLLNGIFITTPIEFQFTSKDGTLGWWEGQTSLIKLDENNTELVLFLREITMTKRMEDELRRYSIEMEKHVEEMGKQLINTGEDRNDQ